MELNKYVPDALIKLVYDDLSMKLDNKYHYHNLHHTKRVINSAGEIGNHYNLSRDDWRDLLTACAKIRKHFEVVEWSGIAFGDE